jgi:hypothetical protein
MLCPSRRSEKAEKRLDKRIDKLESRLNLKIDQTQDIALRGILLTIKSHTEHDLLAAKIANMAECIRTGGKGCA